jgi:dipeptidyl aminopeptidase/acylaminoacyl peptidase
MIKKLFRRAFWAAIGMHVVTAIATDLGPKRQLQAEDFYRLQTVESPACSGDGAWIAYTVTTSDRQADEPRAALWMVNWQGTERIRLTDGAATASAPQFSPDGRYLAYLSAHAEEHPQLVLLDRRGGEAQAISHVSGLIGDYRWSPDSRTIVLSMSPDTEPAGSASSNRPWVIDDFHFKEDRTGYVTAADRSQLYLLEVATRSLKPLTNDVRYRDEHPAWSPDGTKIAYTSLHETDADLSGAQELYVIDARSGAEPARLARFFVSNKQSVVWTSDGKNIVYSVGFEPKWTAYIHDRLATVKSAGGDSRIVTDALDRAVAAPILTAETGTIGVLVEDDRSQYPAVVRLNPSSVTRSSLGSISVTDQCGGGGHVAVLASMDTRAPEIYALERGKLRKLTAHNDALVDELEWGAVQDIAFNSADGTEIHAIMVKPADFQPGRTYPTLLWIHGGPNGQDQHGLAFDTYPLELERQWFAAHGYVVLAVNYRGSSGRGAAFQRSIAGQWGRKEVDDLLAAMDYVVREKIADPARLGLGGWSYGGILTDYVIASDTRFKAAISGAGSANQLAMYGSDEYSLQYSYELGTPWSNTDLWLKVSYPFFHADRIKTPTLFMGGDKDFNVPIGGSEQMYQALRALRVPTELVVYPGEYHLFTRPSHIVDRIQRYLRWFDQYLKP